MYRLKKHHKINKYVQNINSALFLMFQKFSKWRANFNTRIGDIQKGVKVS